MKPQSVRCQSKYHLEHNPSGGNMMMMLEGNSIYVRCNHGTCRRWNKISVSLPGVNVDFSKAALSQEIMPKNFKIGNSTPPVPPNRAPVVLIVD